MGASKRATCIGLAVVALLITACDTNRDVTRPKPEPVTPELLSGALLTEADFPAGFTQAATETAVNAEVLPEHDCDDALTELDPEESVTADFVGNGTVVTSTVAWFPGSAGGAVQAFEDAAEDCEAVVTAEDVTVLAAPLDFGVLSDDTLARRFELTPDTGLIEERDVIVMRDGAMVGVIRLTGPRPSDKELLDDLVRTSIGRLGAVADAANP